MFEAKCGKCGEVFNPADESDTVHIVRADGAECGGQADPDSFGEWVV